MAFCCGVGSSSACFGFRTICKALPREAFRVSVRDLPRLICRARGKKLSDSCNHPKLRMGPSNHSLTQNMIVVMLPPNDITGQPGTICRRSGKSMDYIFGRNVVWDFLRDAANGNNLWRSRHISNMFAASINQPSSAVPKVRSRRSHTAGPRRMKLRHPEAGRVAHRRQCLCRMNARSSYSTNEIAITELRRLNLDRRFWPSGV